MAEITAHHWLKSRLRQKWAGADNPLGHWAMAHFSPPILGPLGHPVARTKYFLLEYLTNIFAYYHVSMLVLRQYLLEEWPNGATVSHLSFKSELGHLGRSSDLG